jgi:hypothetical protein
LFRANLYAEVGGSYKHVRARRPLKGWIALHEHVSTGCVWNGIQLQHKHSSFLIKHVPEIYLDPTNVATESQEPGADKALSSKIHL